MQIVVLSIAFLMLSFTNAASAFAGRLQEAGADTRASGRYKATSALP